ncbi:MAG: hypothetical protein WCX46_04595 [Candidatus Paceibacterota bacterium]
MNKLQQLKDEVRKEFKEVSRILVNTIKDEEFGQIRTYKGGTTPEQLAFIDYFITKAYEAGLEEAVQVVEREDSFDIDECEKIIKKLKQSQFTCSQCHGNRNDGEGGFEIKNKVTYYYCSECYKKLLE